MPPASLGGRGHTRLLLGSDAYALARAADEAKIASDEEWKELTLSTDSGDAELKLDELRSVVGVSSSAAGA